MEKKKREEQEAKKKEEELRRKEEKRKEEEKQKAIELAKQQAEELKRSKKNKANNNPKQVETKSKKKNKSNQSSKENAGIELMEENIPAVVTIKRIVENNNSPPLVTITLKGSTPDQDKLLYTLVNGQSKSQNNHDVENNKSSSSEQNNKNKKKKKGNNSDSKSNQTKETTSELKVTLAVDKSFRKQQSSDSKGNNSKQTSKNNNTNNNKNVPPPQEYTKPKTVIEETHVDMPYLRLPPGITITKVNGPLTNKNCKSNENKGKSANANNVHQIPPVNKSGVIVVETEKLIQQSMSTSSGKKNKKKKKKPQNANNTQQEPSEKQTTNSSNSNQKPGMVTLKNPIFHSLQNKLLEKNEIPKIPCDEQASITQGENGMVTIRRPGCIQLPMQNETPVSDYISEMKHQQVTSRIPQASCSIGSGKRRNHQQEQFGEKEYVYNSYSNQNDYVFENPPCDPRNSGSNRPLTLSAHEILWGLPGIEITKVSKNSASTFEFKRREQTADVSIIPTTTNGEKFHFDRDDWHYGTYFYHK